MANPAELPMRLFLSRIEEELVAFRTAVANLPPQLNAELLSGLLGRSLALLQGALRIFDILESGEVETSFRREAAATLSELLKVVRDFYGGLDPRYPLFLDTVTVFFEPLSDKLNQLLETLEKSQLEELDLEELAYVFGEIVDTLEVFFPALQKLEEKIL